ncbi:MAG: HAMP domain-containing sensor histidine kinase [Salinivirgaceae bacterium]|nr:HAMP domain-containing sensor histidine kinase [Salinivirgaceae bacterium]MDY0279994.1 HAMP domain-containing sensor histidine kinase [Salinivirgaceae bacterium]
MLLNYDKNYSEKDYFKNHLKIINQQALYLFTTADNLLNWAKKQIDEVSTNIQSCNITNIIDEQITTLSNLYHSKKLKIEKNFHPDLTFHSDPEILNIVLRNVITNAIKYSYEGNKILISVKINNSKLNIAIHDFGIGITDEQIENIMKSDSFVTSLQGTKNEKGTGIGLRLSMELLKTLNGSITIHRNTDKGTNVLIEIPENIPSSV